MFLLKKFDLHRSKRSKEKKGLRMYPPELSLEHSFSILSQIKDWQLNHGSLLKIVQSEEEHSVLSHPIGVSVFPSLFPRTLFQHALNLQTTYNELYCAIAEDEEWLFDVTKDLIPVEPLAAALWQVYDEVKKAGGPVQPISAGIFRSDYMLHQIQNRNGEESDDDGPSSQHKRNPFFSSVMLKQVEFNSYSCAGGSHANKVVDMHRYLARTGAYSFDDQHGEDGKDHNPNPIQLSAMPPNDTINGIASCLAAAHAAYGTPKSQVATETAVLFIVQPYNFNIADERPIEYALWNRDLPVPTYRVDFGEDVLAYTSLTKSGRELLFSPPWLGTKTPPVEVSVAYMRAGYEAEEYEALTGREARLRLEMSRAIKCPSLLSHISTFKKVQQALAVPGTLERWLPSDKAAQIRDTFVPLYPLHDTTENGRTGRRLATHRASAKSHILKPSLEGGGHNVYGEDIPGFLASIPPSRWSSYILMERIRSPDLSNVLMSFKGICAADKVVSELGIFGTCLWRRRRKRQTNDNDITGGCSPPSEEEEQQQKGQNAGERRSHLYLLENSVGGWSFKTKDALVNEMSVVKGYGCFDTPCLV